MVVVGPLDVAIISNSHAICLETCKLLPCWPIRVSASFMVMRLCHLLYALHTSTHRRHIRFSFLFFSRYFSISSFNYRITISITDYYRNATRTSTKIAPRWRSRLMRAIEKSLRFRWARKLLNHLGKFLRHILKQTGVAWALSTTARAYTQNTATIASLPQSFNNLISK